MPPLKNYRIRLTITIPARDDVEARVIFRKVRETGPASRDAVEWEMHEMKDSEPPRPIGGTP